MELNARSEQNLRGVHADLVRVVRLAHRYAVADGMNFIITEGLRTQERQRQLVAERKSTTMNSRHLTGHAIDIAVLNDRGQAVWDTASYVRASRYFFRAANELKIPLRWGGDWNQNGDHRDERFFDGVHFELPARFYP